MHFYVYQGLSRKRAVVLTYLGLPLDLLSLHNVMPDQLCHPSLCCHAGRDPSEAHQCCSFICWIRCCSMKWDTLCPVPWVQIPTWDSPRWHCIPSCSQTLAFLMPCKCLYCHFLPFSIIFPFFSICHALKPPPPPQLFGQNARFSWSVEIFLEHRVLVKRKFGYE